MTTRWTTPKSLITRRLWLTTLLFAVAVDLYAGVAEVTPPDDDKTFRLARCRVRCLASLQVSYRLVLIIESAACTLQSNGAVTGTYATASYRFS